MITLVGGITLATIIGALALYMNWLSDVEKLRERESRVRDAIKGECYSRGGIEFEVIRVTFQEEGSRRYEFRKYIPYFRRLNGFTELTLRAKPADISLRADGIGFGAYFWNRRSIDDFLGSEYPTIEHIETDSSQEYTVTKLRLHSMELAALQRSLDKIPSYLKEIIDEYPGEAEIRTVENSD